MKYLLNLFFQACLTFSNLLRSPFPCFRLYANYWIPTKNWSVFLPIMDIEIIGIGLIVSDPCSHYVICYKQFDHEF